MASMEYGGKILFGGMLLTARTAIAGFCGYKLCYVTNGTASIFVNRTCSHLRAIRVFFLILSNAITYSMLQITRQRGLPVVAITRTPIASSRSLTVNFYLGQVGSILNSHIASPLQDGLCVAGA